MMGKILIFGDSIAYGKWDHEGGWVTRLRRIIDSDYNIGKGGNLLVYNMGIPGEVATRMLRRVQSELFERIDPQETNVVLIAIGINDSCPNNRIQGYQTPEPEFKQTITQMIEIARSQNCKVGILGLTPVNPEKSKGLKFTNPEVQRYDAYLTEVAAQQNVPKLEIFEELLANGFSQMLVDSVHPDAAGHEILTQKVKNFLEDSSLLKLVTS